MSKVGLVLEGGGLKCAYGAGVLDCFLDDNINFDYVIGVSAGSANGVSYLAGQRDRNKRFYTEHINDKLYMGMKSYIKTGDMFGLDYIYSTLTNSSGADPLDFEKLMANPAEYELVATNALTGEAEYFPKEVFVKDDYKEIKASCAIPAACRPVFINGVPYFDGGVADAIPVKRALEMGCDRIVVVTTKHKDYVRQPESFKLFYSKKCRKYPKIIERLNNHHVDYMNSFEYMLELEKEGKAFVIAPSKPLELPTFKKDPKENEQMYRFGIEDYKKIKKELFDFMKK